MTEAKPPATLRRRLQGMLSAVFSDELLPQRRKLDDDQNDQFERYMVRARKVAYRYTLVVIALLLAPIDAYNYISGHIVAAAAGLLVLLLFLWNFVLLSQDREPFLSPPTVLLLTLGLLMLSLVYGLNYNLYWIYPLLVTLPILLKTPAAIWLAILTGIIVTPFVWMRFDANTAVIVCLSMAHTWLISAWLMYAVSAQSRQLSELAGTDPLTGALNRRRMKAEAKQALQGWQRYQRLTTALLIDVDHFKLINDELGHEAGDRALCQLVDVLRTRLRELDHVYRLGGEEFVVLLPATDEVSALYVAEALRSHIERTELLPGRKVTISIGVCEVSMAVSVDQWLSHCDRALYQAKAEGRNRVVIATPGEIVLNTTQVA